MCHVLFVSHMGCICPIVAGGVAHATWNYLSETLVREVLCEILSVGSLDSNPMNWI